MENRQIQFHPKINFAGISFLISIMLLFMIGLTIDNANAQDNSLNYEIRSAVYAGLDGSLPFWFHSNVNGKVDPSGTNILNEMSLDKTFLERGPVSLKAAGNVIYRISGNFNSPYLSELYLQARGYGLQLDAGRFPQTVRLNDNDLSAGSMMVSNNTVPMPGISFSTVDFVKLPFSDGAIRYKAMFSHNWFESDRHVSSPYLHKKYIYLRVNSGPFFATGGIVHNVVWAGEAPGFGQLPNSLNDFFRVITGLGADKTSNVPDGEVTNVIGNSLAAYEFGLTYNADHYSISLNRLFYLEDKVSTRFRSPWDGAWGANLDFHEHNPILDAVTYEHFNTKQQDAKKGEIIGRASYYNHSIYRNGWTYNGRVLGLPLARYDKEKGRITSNIMVGHHVGFKGRFIDNLQYKVFFTYARHYGTKNDRVSNGEVIPLNELRRDQYSWILDIGYGFRNQEGLGLSLKLGSDFGEFYDTKPAVMLGVSWSGVFNEQ